MLTVVLTSKNVLREFEHWLCYFKEYKEYDLLCYCVDNSSVKFCEKYNIKFVDISKEHSLHDNNFWITKAYIFKEISKNCSFIYSDLDALWIENPIEILKSNLESDILFSQGTYFPKHVNNKLGFVFCAGFFYVNKIGSAEKFFEEVYVTTLNGNKDDQYNINDLLMNDLQELNKSKFSTTSFNNEEFKIFDDFLNFLNETYKLKISLIPHKIVVRKSLLKTKEAVIVHPVEKNIYGNIYYFYYKNNILHKQFSFSYKYSQIILTIVYLLKARIKKFRTYPKTL